MDPILPTRDNFLLNCIGTTDACDICLEPFHQTHIPANFMGTRYCKHVFGEACLRRWVSISNKCPKCRCELYQSVVTDENNQQQEVGIDDPDAESELCLENFSRNLKGKILMALYLKACEDRSIVRDAIRGDTTRMWDCIWQVIANDPLGGHYLSHSHGVSCYVETELKFIQTIVNMVIVEGGRTLSGLVREQWIDQMYGLSSGDE